MARESTSVASIRWDGISDRPPVTHLRPGQAARFGFCACGRCSIEYRLDVPGVRGAVIAEPAVCWLSNQSRQFGLLVWDLEDPQQSLRLPPGRLAMPIPFELAQVGVGRESPFMTVFGPEPSTDGGATDLDGCRGVPPAPRLDPRATYYAVLQVLIDAWSSPDQAGLPTSEEVAAILRQRGWRITGRAVDHHIDYLTRRIPLPQADGQRGKRETLVHMCVAQGWLDR